MCLAIHNHVLWRGKTALDMKQLITFMTLTRTLNYQKAAQQLQYAPSTLFKHIQLLEQELGAPLFYKEGRQICLTQEGEVFAGHAGRILDNYYDALGSVRDAREAEATVCVGGCEINTANSLLGLLKQFTKAYPGVRLSMMTSPNANVPGLVRRGITDLGFYYTPENQAISGVQMIPLYREPVYLMVSQNHPMAGRRRMTYEDLQGIDFVYPHDTCCFVQDLLPRLAARRVRLGEIAYLGGVHLVVEHVRAGRAMTLVPHCAAGRFADTYELAALDMAEAPLWAWETVIYKNFEALNPAARALVRHSVQHAQRAIGRDDALCAPAEQEIV